MAVLMESTRPFSLWNRFGLAASGLCAVHCILTSIIVGFAPGLMKELGWSERWETALLLLSLLIVALALWLGKHASHFSIGFWLLAAFLLLITRAFSLDFLTPGVAIFLAAASWTGRRKCACNACRTAAEEPLLG